MKFSLNGKSVSPLTLAPGSRENFIRKFLDKQPLGDVFTVEGLIGVLGVTEHMVHGSAPALVKSGHAVKSGRFMYYASFATIKKLKDEAAKYL